jgi:hypothetical protein
MGGMGGGCKFTPNIFLNYFWNHLSSLLLRIIFGPKVEEVAGDGED